MHKDDHYGFIALSREDTTLVSGYYMDIHPNDFFLPALVNGYPV